MRIVVSLLVTLGASGLLACSEAAGTSTSSSASPALEELACPSSLARPGDSTLTLISGGVTRSYQLHVPPSYSGQQKVPLVVDMHGFGSNARHHQSISGWLAKSDQEGFLLAQPDGLHSSWNGGTTCCGRSQAEGVDDEAFLRALVAELERDACADSRRVYASGLSNGGAMAHLLACRASDLFAATAPLAMGNGTVPCQPARPISVAMWRATSDQLVPYHGGTAAGLDLSFPSAEADFAQWRDLNACVGKPRTTDGICQTYTDCQDDVEVSLCTVQTSESDLLGGHVLYPSAAAQGAAVADVAWALFRRHSRL